MFSRITIASARPSVTVVGVTSDGKTVPSAHAKVQAVADALDTPGFAGDSGEVLAAGPKHVLLGLGASDAVTPATVRAAAAKLVKALDRRKDKGIDIDLSAGFPKKRAEVEALGRAFAEGLAIANWRVDRFDGAATRRQPRGGALAIDSRDADFRDGLRRGLVLGDAVNHARAIGATPPNICNPAWVAAQARRLARETGLKCTVIDHAKAKRMGMGGLVTVGHGSESKSCLIHLAHVPRKRARGAKGKKLVLVGKTLTYDTGGYSLKVNNGMKGMKYDKMGGCAVIGAMKAIAELDLPVEVHALLAAAENMVSGDSMRPDDIITMYNGVTVEITNTDAEGRLVLADALTYAEKHLGATAIIDMATLTGGVVVALGHFCAGWFCNDEGLSRAIEAASAESGERLWKLPLWKEHRDFMRGQHADLINSNPARSAHPIQGAAFLSYFVDEKTPWAHIDIAGVGNVDSASDLFVAGPTGWGVRLLTDWAEGETK
ncbi:MAG: leucyl aminopeptidase family protein [Planctomycetes bacterium]|nr:leucyl aminopeptidase family protein [Planctomycetota bacterium]